MNAKFVFPVIHSHILTRAVVFLLAVIGAHANSLVQFRTVLGDVDVELFDQEKPATVANFKRYVDAGAYRDSFFHRAIHNFVIQGGGFRIDHRSTTNAQLAAINAFESVTNEIHVGPFRSNLPGTIAMAKTADPNSATSEFFFNLADNSVGLDSTNNSGGFTVFGQAVGNTNVLANLNSFVGFRTPLTNVIVNAKGVFSMLPVLQFDTNSGALSLDTLVYVDVSFLAVQVVELSGHRHEISWESSHSGTNHVEFTTALPPVWQSLTNLVTPTALRTKVVDEVSDLKRFYRVRISY